MTFEIEADCGKASLCEFVLFVEGQNCLMCQKCFPHSLSAMSVS